MADSPRRSGTPSGGYHRRFDQETRQVIIRRYRAGETCAEIAADLKTSSPTINLVLRKAWVQLRPPARRPGRRPTPATVEAVYPCSGPECGEELRVQTGLPDAAKTVARALGWRTWTPRLRGQPMMTVFTCPDCVQAER